MTAAGVSYEPVGEVEGLAADGMEHGGMRDLATVRMNDITRIESEEIYCKAPGLFVWGAQPVLL